MILTLWNLPLQILRPYAMNRDSYIALIVITCLLFSSYIYARTNKILIQLFKDFILHREHTSVLRNTTTNELRFLVLLIGQTCVLVAICCYALSIYNNPALLDSNSSLALIGIYTLCNISYIVFKWFIYHYIGYTFFDKEKSSIWSESYFTLIYYSGFILFPICLVIVYLQINATSALILCLIPLVVVKLLILYKAIKLFCIRYLYILLFILYFCTLEIMPLLIFCKGISILNKVLI